MSSRRRSSDSKIIPHRYDNFAPLCRSVQAAAEQYGGGGCQLLAPPAQRPAGILSSCRPELSEWGTTEPVAPWPRSRDWCRDTLPRIEAQHAIPRAVVEGVYWKRFWLATFTSFTSTCTHSSECSLLKRIRWRERRGSVRRTGGEPRPRQIRRIVAAAT